MLNRKVVKVVHPNKFFKEVYCRTRLDVFEVFDEDLKFKLQSIHPQNFIKTKITLPVYKLIIDYYTENENHKIVERYMVLDNLLEDEFSDCWADMYCNDYKRDHPNRKMRDLNITSLEYICDVVLPIG